MLRKRITANAAANVVAQAVNVVIQLGAVPIFLHFWTKERYGDWLVLFTIPNYLSLADVGLPAVVGNEAAMLAAAGKAPEARRILHTGYGLMLAVAAALTLVVAAGGFLLPWGWLFGESRLDGREISYGISLLGAYTAVGLLASLYGAVYRAADRAPRGVYAYTWARLFETVAMMTVVGMGDSIVTLAATLLVARAATTAVMYLDCNHLTPDLKLGLADFSGRELRRTLRPGLLYMAYPLGNAFYFQGLTLIAGKVLGPVAVVVFNTCRTLTRAVVQLLTIVRYSIMPEFSYLMGRGELARMGQLHGLAFEFSALVATAVSAVMLLVGPWILKIWTHAQVMPSRWLLALFLASAILNTMWNMAAILLISSNRHERVAASYLAISIAALLASGWLARLAGVAGLAWSMIGCDVLLLPITVVNVCTLLEQPVASFAWRVASLQHLAGIWRGRRPAAATIRSSDA